MRKRIFGVILGLIAIAGSILPSYAALQYQETYNSSDGVNKVLLLVNSSIYDAIYPLPLNKYISDMESENYNITLTKYIGGTAGELKDYIKLFYTGHNLKGVIFVGDMPNIYFEIANDYNQYGYQSFPIDLYYMDLDGQWSDTDNNGVLDTHNAGTGSLTPEIWLGRLTASPIYNETMDEVGLLKNYFYKDHAYRTGKLSITQRALAYPDDDWSYFNNCNLDGAYSNVVVVNDKDATNAADYKTKLAGDYEWIQVCAHSNETLHSFAVTSGAGGLVYNTDIKTIDPKALFYNLFACSNAKYTASNYMGGHYIFAKTDGLAAVGSTKIGSMLSFDLFYPNLGSTKRNSLGEAFKQWFSNTNLSDFNQRCWFYGMTLLGDPTFSLDPPVSSIDSINPTSVSKGQTVQFSGSGKISTGSITAYSWRSNLDGLLSSNASFSTSSLSVGTHTIYFKVQDNKDRWSSEIANTVTVNPAAPNVLEVGTIDPTSGSSRPGGWVNFNATYSGAVDWRQVVQAYFLMNTSVNGANGLFVYFDQLTGKLYLRNDAGTAWLGGYMMGSNNVIENSYAKVDCYSTTMSGSSNTMGGRTMAIRWVVALKAPFAGTKNTYLYAKDNSNATAGWKQVGTWTIVNNPPQVGTITPSSGSISSPNQWIDFATTYTDADGWQDIQLVMFLMNTSITGVNSMFAYYNKNTNKLYLRNDASTGWLGGYAPGSNNVIENSYAKLDCASTTVQGSSTTLTVHWMVALKSTFTGTKNTYLYVQDNANANSGWKQVGTLTIPHIVNNPPQIGTISPSSGSAVSNQTVNFTTTYTDGNGKQDIQMALFLMNTSITGVKSLFVYYNQNTNKLYLRNDTGSAWLGGYAPGSNNVIENSYAKLNCAGTTIQAVDGYTMAINWSVVLKPTFTGAKNTYLYVQDNANANSGWKQVGTWTIQ